MRRDWSEPLSSSTNPPCLIFFHCVFLPLRKLQERNRLQALYRRVLIAGLQGLSRRGSVALFRGLLTASGGPWMPQAPNLDIPVATVQQ